eukprot:m51a1_g442 hypothetical protein (249) ;mRNA; r:81804-82677
MTPTAVVAAGVAAVPCRCGGPGSEIRCGQCASRVLIVQLLAHSDTELCQTVVAPDGLISERYSFATRTGCTHVEVAEACVKMRLGEQAVTSTTAFSMNMWRKLPAKRSRPRGSEEDSARRPPLPQRDGRCTEVAEHSSCQPIPPAVPRRLIVRVTMHVQRDTAITATIVNAVEYVRINVAGCVNNVVRYLPGTGTGARLSFVVVSVWESQLALANADEFYERCRQLDRQLAPACFPRVSLVSDVRSLK